MKFRYILVVVVPFHLFGKPLIMEMKAKFPWRFDGFWEFLPLHIHQSRWQWRFGILSLSKYVYCNDQSKSTNKQKLDKILDLLFFSTPSSCTVNARNVIGQHLKKPNYQSSNQNENRYIPRRYTKNFDCCKFVGNLDNLTIQCLYYTSDQL